MIAEANRLVAIIEARFRQELSKREKQVAILLASNLSKKEVAAKLRISVHTVDRHAQSTYEKLRIHSLCQLTHWAIANGLVKARADWRTTAT